jgi:hypothetical protein
MDSQYIIFTFIYALTLLYQISILSISYKISNLTKEAKFYIKKFCLSQNTILRQYFSLLWCLHYHKII